MLQGSVAEEVPGVLQMRHNSVLVRVPGVVLQMRHNSVLVRAPGVVLQRLVQSCVLRPVR